MINLFITGGTTVEGPVVLGVSGTAARVTVEGSVILGVFGTAARVTVERSVILGVSGTAARVVAIPGFPAAPGGQNDIVIIPVFTRATAGG